MDIINKDYRPSGEIRFAVFDFDGTISALRCGWEKIMLPLMLECMSPGAEPSEALREEAERYIDESTGIQTIYQMQWLAERVNELTGVMRPAQWYKDEYLRRLALSIAHKKQALADGSEPPENYLIAGSAEFLKALAERGITLYLASGTDHKDVVYEAELLGVKDYFAGIYGAPKDRADCSKEAVLRMLLEEKNISGRQLLVAGDGKVEIALGKQNGAFALGAATDEEKLHGVNPVKYSRLLKAGADAITGDFIEKEEILKTLGL